jgi:hypothetical protein
MDQVPQDKFAGVMDSKPESEHAVDSPSPLHPDQPQSISDTAEPWYTFAEKADEEEVRNRFAAEIAALMAAEEKLLSDYCCLALLKPDHSLGQWDLDRIFSGLNEANSNRERNVLLFLLSPGGSIEPAYQISKLCKQYAAKKFVVCIPRQAKSAATLIAIGADEIHMGTLGQLGPIDPQLGGLPALGVARALETIAALAQKYPGSAEMFAKYLQQVLTVEQIGYYDRISESAVQYAQRLLSTKAHLRSRAGEIARELVHEYKDHGFVIDLAEAQLHLGSEWVKSGTAESEFAERLYDYYDMVNLMLALRKKTQPVLMGRLDAKPILFNRQD